jgi:hypothetical protein
VLAKEHVVILVNNPVASKTFSQMGVQSNFIASASSTAKSNRADDGGGVLCHEGKV